MSFFDLLDPPLDAPALLPDRFQKWFAGRGWSPREHQLALLKKAREDRSALLIAPTGAGKTLAGFLPTLVELSAGIHLPLKGGGRRAQRDGWGSAANTEQAADPHPDPPLSGGGSPNSVLRATSSLPAAA